MVEPGMTGLKIEKEAGKWIKRNGYQSAIKKYMGYPSLLCISVNFIAAHGVTNDREFQTGDVVKIEVALNHHGWFGDCCGVEIAGTGDAASEKLIQVSKGATAIGIQASQIGATTGDIGFTIEDYVKYHEHRVLKEFTGHGIGKKLHMGPSITSFGRPGTGDKIVENMAFTVEPIITHGNPSFVIEDDQWSVSMVDKAMTCQVEETIIITKSGPDILTR